MHKHAQLDEVKIEIAKIGADMKKIIIPILLVCSMQAKAECVYSQRSATQVRILDSHALVIYGGSAGYTLIKTTTPLSPGMPVSVSADSFCDYAPDAIYSGSIPVAVSQIRNLH
ncbi:hypothetical protein [Burkholderia pseudomallei]|uniref:hypothetical protein n=1 Tax=Burkholderia pseudomallei TaxID=28450 RepID=UPI0011784C66|nr:hypothetical protein [Burkholderia pseudomallei]